MKAPLEIDAYLYIVRFFPRCAGLFGVFFLLCFFSFVLCSQIRDICSTFYFHLCSQTSVCHLISLLTLFLSLTVCLCWSLEAFDSRGGGSAKKRKGWEDRRL